MNQTVLSDVRTVGSQIYDYDEQREGYQPYEAWLSRSKAEKEAKNEKVGAAAVATITTKSDGKPAGEVKLSKPIPSK